MAVMKKNVRKKLSKYLARLVKKHGAEMTLALVTGIVSSLAAEKPGKIAAKKAAKAEKARVKARVIRTERPVVKTVVIRKRAAR